MILFFYPFDFTFVCPTEIMAFNSVVEDLRAKGAEVPGHRWGSLEEVVIYSGSGHLTPGGVVGPF